MELGSDCLCCRPVATGDLAPECGGPTSRFGVAFVPPVRLGVWGPGEEITVAAGSVPRGDKRTVMARTTLAGTSCPPATAKHYLSQTA